MCSFGVDPQELCLYAHLPASDERVPKLIRCHKCKRRFGHPPCMSDTHLAPAEKSRAWKKLWCEPCGGLNNTDREGALPLPLPLRSHSAFSNVSHFLMLCVPCSMFRVPLNRLVRVKAIAQHLLPGHPLSLQPSKSPSPLAAHAGNSIPIHHRCARVPLSCVYAALPCTV